MALEPAFGFIRLGHRVVVLGSLLDMATDDRPLAEEVPSEVKVSATLSRGMSSSGYALGQGQPSEEAFREHSCRSLDCPPNTSDIPVSQRVGGLWSLLSARSLNDRYRVMSRHGELQNLRYVAVALQAALKPDQRKSWRSFRKWHKPGREADNVFPDWADLIFASDGSCSLWCRSR